MSSQERFWSKVEVSDPDACWPWTGATSGTGYGAMRWPTGEVASPVVAAHRIAAMIAGMDTTKLIRHTCDNPRCCNPRHLETGSHFDNSQDMVRRKRWSNGSPKSPGRRTGDPWRKLTDDDVDSVRQRFAAGETQADIARSFGVSHALINAIVHGRKRVKDGADYHPFIGGA